MQATAPLYWPELPMFNDRATYPSGIIPQKIIPFAIEIQCKIKRGVFCRAKGNPGERVRDNYREDDTFTIMGIDVNDPGFYVARPSWQNVIEPVFLLSRHMKVCIQHTVVSDKEIDRIKRATAMLRP